MKVYFDNAATTPVDPEVTEAICAVLRDGYGNPSSIHEPGRIARNELEKARKIIAGIFQVPPATILFTSCATESINMAMASAVEAGVEQIITSRLEHHAILRCSEHYEKHNRCAVRYLPNDSEGNLSLPDLENFLSSGRKSLVVLMHANNEIGNLLPLEKVAALCEARNAFFLCDTVQSVGKVPLRFDVPGLSYATGSAHKFHGPKGIGFLYHAQGAPCTERIFGGGQERGLRSGTENVPGVAGMARALELCVRKMDDATAHIASLKEYFSAQLEKEIPAVTFHGTSRSGGLKNILSINFPENEKSGALIQLLDMEGIAVSGGSACNSGVSKGSHVLRALRPDAKGTSVRLSFSRFNTKEEVDYCLSVLKKWF